MFTMFKLLLPALIPSWRFFDVIAASPRIEYAQMATPSEAVMDWREFRPRPERLSMAAMLGRLFWNAQWNEALYVVSCAERLLTEPTTHSQDEIFRRVVAALIERIDPRKAWVSFRIVLVSEGEGVITRNVAFVSEPRRLEAISVQ